jgi:hypothetical protein
MREERFSSAASEIAQRHRESVSFDRRFDHTPPGLASAGIVADNEFELIARGLREIEDGID